MASARDRILETTCELLEAQGFQATGLNQIIRDSGAPKGSLYYYFPDGKEGLVAEAVARSAKITAERIETNLATHENPAEAVKTFVYTLAQHLRASDFRSGGPITTTALEAAATNERVREACNQAYQSWQAAFKAKLVEGGYIEGRATSLAALIVASIEGAVTLGRTERSVLPLHQTASELYRLLNKPRKGLQADELQAAQQGTTSPTDPERAGSATILVTGATGNVGREVVRRLLDLGEPVVAAVQDAQDAQRVPGDGTATTAFDLCEPETYPTAFSGVRRLFLMRPPRLSDVKRTLFPVIDHARQAGVEHIIFLSLLGAERNNMVPHHKVERYIQDSGLPYTFLRPSFYMQNLNTTHQAEIRDGDELMIPAGKGKTSFVDVRDIGAVAAKVLTEAGHEGQAYALTGAEALDYYQVASLLTEALGRWITYQQPSIPRFLQATHKRGVAWPFALVMAGLYTSTRFGMAGQVTGDIERLLGRPPTSLRQYAQDYAWAWQPASETQTY